jgi:hypothetical protein
LSESKMVWICVDSDMYDARFGRSKISKVSFRNSLNRNFESKISAFLMLNMICWMKKTASLQFSILFILRKIFFYIRKKS